MRAQTDKAPAFEVASIKPMKTIPQGVFLGMRPGGRFVANAVTVKFLLEEAYGVKDAQVTGAPPWLGTERFDIDAKPDEATAVAIDKMPPEQRRQQLMLMLQSLLADRFKLSITRKQKDLPVYALVVGKGGPKFHESTFKPPESSPDTPRAPGIGGPAQMGIMMNGRGEMTVTYGDMVMFASVLSRFVGRPVINGTGLPGKYDFTLHWTPDETDAPMMPGQPRPDGAASAPPDTSGPSIFTAVQDQLGLKLEAQKNSMEVLVIQHVERPSEN